MRPKHPFFVGLSCWLCVVLLLTGCMGNGAASDAAGSRPNIVFVLTDDQDLLLGSMEYMPQVNALLTKQGTTFSNFFVNLPLCCPARAMVFTGQYPHNNGILTNLWPTGGFPKAYYIGLEEATLSTALHDVGYRTALFGKYLNGYPLKADPTYIPPGWDEWWAPITDSAYASYDYEVNHNGQIERYGRAPQDYITDVMTQQALAFLGNSSRDHPDMPFFLMFSVYPPHSPAEPAPRHVGLFADVQAPRTPSFNEADVSDKAPFMQQAPLLTDEQIAQMDTLYRRRLQSLQSVDEAVAQLVHALEANGQLDNTYIVFASDNGFHMGQHRMVSGKGMVYEEDIHVPLIVRGPGVRQNATRDELTAIIDLAPTFTELAGAPMANTVDGRSLLPLLGRGKATGTWRQMLLLEHYTAPSTDETKALSNALEPPDPGDLQQATLEQNPPDYMALRTARYKYVQRIGTARELYDMKSDPHELVNRWNETEPAFQQALADLIEAYRTCVGQSCRDLENQQPPRWP